MLRRLRPAPPCLCWRHLLQAVSCPPPAWPARPWGLLRPVTLWKRRSSWDHISRFNHEAGSLVSLSSQLSSSLLPTPHSALHQPLLQRASQPLRSGTLQSRGPTPASPTTRITALKVWGSAKPGPWGTHVLVLCGSLTRAPHTTEDGDQSPPLPPGARLPSLMVFFLSCPRAAMLWPKLILICLFLEFF